MLKVLMVMMVMGVGLVDAGRRPHLVTFMIDDVGWSDLGFRNGSSMLTPNLDAAMRTGVNLDRFYAQPVCSPSRAAFLQGRYPFRTGLQHFTTIQPASPAHMPLDIPTLAETLGSVGYDAHAIGKWYESLSLLFSSSSFF
ncbi:MAG: sulfatase-like hydrolase/transferase, partial [archaeon]|nr:sulfatase-like hydrolase/transferase [archaeon]